METRRKKEKANSNLVHCASSRSCVAENFSESQTETPTELSSLIKSWAKPRRAALADMIRQVQTTEFQEKDVPARNTRNHTKRLGPVQKTGEKSLTISTKIREELSDEEIAKKLKISICNVALNRLTDREIAYYKKPTEEQSSDKVAEGKSTKKRVIQNRRTARSVEHHSVEMHRETRANRKALKMSEVDEPKRPKQNQAKKRVKVSLNIDVHEHIELSDELVKKPKIAQCNVILKRLTDREISSRKIPADRNMSQKKPEENTTNKRVTQKAGSAKSVEHQPVEIYRETRAKRKALKKSKVDEPQESEQRQVKKGVIKISAVIDVLDHIEGPKVDELSSCDAVHQDEFNLDEAENSSSLGHASKAMKNFNVENIDDGDPYVFNLSQSSDTGNGPKKSKKVAKARRAAKVKPGNTMNLLIQQKTMNIAGTYSCTVQNNPEIYEAEQSYIAKQLSCPIVSTQKKNDVSQAKTTATVKKSLVHLQPNYSKVWHSPPGVKLASSNIHISSKPLPFAMPSVSSSPAQYTYARKTSGKPFVQTPLRVPETFPSTFYMGLSKSDNSPSFSSDLIEGDTISDEKIQEKRVVNIFGASRNVRNESIESESNVENIPPQSMLSDSNAENMEPLNYVQKASSEKILRRLTMRSPLKSIPIPTTSFYKTESPLAVYNKTALNIESQNNLKVVENHSGEESRVSVDHIAVIEKNIAEITEQEDNNISRNFYGFDELLEDENGMDESAANKKYEIPRIKLKDLRKYLPSKSNKDRDSEIFPTSPVKNKNLFASPSKAKETSIKKFFSSSTPFNHPTAKAKLQFYDTSKVDEINESNVTYNTNGDTVGSDSEINLFDQHEANGRSYSRKRGSDFLNRIEEGGSESEEEQHKKIVRLRRKKQTVEETAEFKDFIKNKTQEFAEVDDFKMVVD